MTAAAGAEVPPGSWQQFADHFPRPITPEYERLFRATFEPAQAEVYERYGIPFRGLRVAVIGGYVYLAPEPLVGDPAATLPPKPVLWVATRVVPAFRRRRAQAKTVLRDRPWLDDVDHWRRELRPLWERTNLALQDVPVGEIDDQELAAHLRRCRANAEEGYRLHFRLHGPDLVATGLLLARGQEWGIDPRELLDALVGSSPASTGRDADLEFVRTRLAAASQPPTTVDDIHAAGPDVAAALDRYLRTHGRRVVTGYDVDSRCLDELPGLIVALVSTPPERSAAPVEVEPLRDRVPGRDRPEFDRLLSDANATYGLRDENGGLTGAWPIGLLRHAMLAVGRRLAERGRLADPEHAVEVTVDELLDLLAGTSELGATDVAGRAAARAEAGRTPPPPTLGPPLPGPDAVGLFPEPLRLMVRAQVALLEGSLQQGSEPLTGLGVGGPPVTGRARVASDAADALDRLQPGEILVTASTTPAFNASLSIAGGLVVDQGGYLSHAAVTARELGLPAVIGASGATTRIPDGSVVEVDPARGLARVLDTAALTT